MSRKSKEAIALLIDCGKSMSQKSLNCDKSVFQLSKQCLENIIRQKIFAETKNQYLLVEFSKTIGTGVAFNGRLRQLNFDLLKYITDSQLTLNDNNYQKNVMEALSETIDRLLKEVKGEKFSCLKLALFTNFNNISQMDLNRFQSDISKRLAQNSIHLIIICDFTPNTLFEGQNESQRLALKLMEMTEKLSIGFCYDLKTAIKAFSIFEVKNPSPNAWYSNLELGRGLNAITIPISAHVKAAPYKRKTGSISLVRTPSVPQTTSVPQTAPVLETASIPQTSITSPPINTLSTSVETQDNSQKSVTPITKVTTFVSQSLNTSVEVTKEEVIRGYPYAQTVVPFDENDKRMFSYENLGKGIKIIGFTSYHGIEFSQRMSSKTTYVFADPRPKQNNHKLLFQALVSEMCCQQKVAIVRYCYSDSSNPQLGYLFPLIEEQTVLLVYIQLPFADDIRRHRFPSLESDSKNSPTEEQLKSIDNLIDSMDLMSADFDDDFVECEAFKTHEMPDPMLQHWYQCLYEKHVNQRNLPQMPDSLKTLIDPPIEMSKKAVIPLKEIIEAFPLESPKVKKNKLKVSKSNIENGSPLKKRKFKGESDEDSGEES